MVFCRHCGATLYAGARECHECGEPAPRVAPPPSPPRAPQAAGQPAPLAPVAAAPPAPKGPPSQNVKVAIGATFAFVGLGVIQAQLRDPVSAFALILLAIATILPLALASLLAWGLWRRSKVARIAAFVLGTFFAVSLVVSTFFGFGRGGSVLEIILSLARLAAIVVGSFALSRARAEFA